MNDQQEIALRLGERSLHGARGLTFERWSGILDRGKKPLSLLLALLIGWALSRLPVPSGLEKGGILFLATLATGVILWGLNVFDEYIVALMLLLAWVMLDVAPSDIALEGFSKSSWFFVIGALGIGAALNKSGLFNRAAIYISRNNLFRRSMYPLIFIASGLLATPLLPNVKARITVMAPVIQAISKSIRLTARSNGSARLALSAYVGFSQFTFMFLTGGPVCLVGWSLMPAPAKSEFGWLSWALAALPAGIVIFFAMLTALFLLYPLTADDRAKGPAEAADHAPPSIGGPLNRSEWISLAAMVLALGGWLSKPVHGIAEPWIALGALVVFLTTGELDKKTFKNGIDWGIVLFFGVVYSMGSICSYLKVDRWLSDLLTSSLLGFSSSPVSFLATVLLVVYFLRFFLAKIPTVILLMLALMPSAPDHGIHPGALLLTILLAVETWFLPYQNRSYLLAYQSTGGEAFSHAEARKLMVVKFVASFMALLISIPYWMMLGLIR